MPTRKSPAEKKVLAYQKDHIVNAEYPHAFRRQWPVKKARANRAFRRQAHQLLNEVDSATLDQDDSGEVQLETVRRRVVRKWGSPAPLGAWVEERKRLRVVRTAHNFFKTPYASHQHRERFTAFLATLVEGRAGNSRELAVFLNDLLDAPESAERPPYPYGASPGQRQWLTAFLYDSPEWEPRLRAWIRQLLIA